MKSVTIAYENALLADSVRYGFLAEIETAGFGLTHFWSGVGTLSWNGFNWIGLGALGAIRGMGETAEIRTTETSYEMSGITNNPELAKFLDQDIRGKIAKAWFALLDENERVIPDPLQIDETILDYSMSKVGDDLGSILVLIGTSAVFDFRRPKSLGITNEQQQLDFPGDTGFDRIPTEVADKQISWTDT